MAHDTHDDDTAADETATDDATTTQSLPLPDTLSTADLAALREDTRVPFVDARIDHPDADHCSTDTAGRAVAGITNDAGEVHLLRHEESGMPLLPHQPVASEADDWAAAARSIVDGWDGLAVDTVELVREVDHHVDGETDPHTTTKLVLFGGSATGDAATDLAVPGDEWTADWHARPPAGIDDLDSPLRDDLAYFFD
jgi:hypothetical protein